MVRRVALAVAVALLMGGCTGDTEPTGTPGRGGSGSAVASPSPTPSASPDRAQVATRPRSATQARQALIRAERTIADPSTRTQPLVRAARSEQLAYRELGVHPDWDATVLDGLPPDLRSVVRDNTDARREFRAMHTDLADTLPAWRIVTPVPADELLRDYRAGERAYGIGWEYLAAINLVETAMGRIRGTSSAGAQGPMQFLPSTWARWGAGGDIEDPADAIMAAARYLAHDGGANGRLAEALYRYNNSQHYVRGVTLLAQVMERRPRAFYGYYHWEVYYLTSRGDVRLPVGYDEERPVPVGQWLRAHPAT